MNEEKLNYLKEYLNLVLNNEKNELRLGSYLGLFDNDLIEKINLIIDSKDDENDSNLEDNQINTRIKDIFGKMKPGCWRCNRPFISRINGLIPFCIIFSSISFYIRW